MAAPGDTYLLKKASTGYGKLQIIFEGFTLLESLTLYLWRM